MPQDSAQTVDTSLAARHRSDPVKAGGVHYTPSALAEFVAARAALALGPKVRIRVLDPACGDGALLMAVARALSGAAAVELVGFDVDRKAIGRARSALASLPDNCSHRVERLDFIEAILDEAESEAKVVRGPGSKALWGSFDVVIANPPYVRTQVLGSKQAQRLAADFGLTGRLDLYQAFSVAMSAALRPKGVLALLCSNRFLTTKSGTDLRRMFRSEFEMIEIFDLGDTKAFEAAVLPAVVIARRDDAGTALLAMTSIYEADAEPAQQTAATIFEALKGTLVGTVRVASTNYDIRRGLVDVKDEFRPWIPSSSTSAALVSRIDEHAVLRFGDVGKFRVGIKTTADSVFIREEWSSLPRPPEPSVIVPLITHHVAERWSGRDPVKSVLYPYDLTASKRIPADLSRLPGTAAYLEKHRERLEGRKYVVDGGRLWWEIWVPHRPSGWAAPKLVCPDISAEPKFFLDTSGAIVNGDCYWLSIADEELALLMLAVANSDVGLAYYDAVCGNRLYAGRRRFITQYIERFPIPDPALSSAKELVEVVRELVTGAAPDQHTRLERRVDELVRISFELE